MAYTLTNWQDSPSIVTPLTASNLLLYNSAINDIDTRIVGCQADLTVAAVQTSNYTATVNQIVPVNTTSGSVTVTFPTSPADGSQLVVRHVVRGGANIVTLQLGGSNTFNTTTGPTSATLPALSQSAEFQYVAATGVWLGVAADVPLSATTARSIAMSMVLGAFSP